MLIKNGSTLVNPQRSSFFAHKNAADQSSVGPSDTKITFGTESWDYGSCYDAANSKFIPQTAGIYLINVVLNMTVSADKNFWLVLYKNNSFMAQLAQTHSRLGAAMGITGNIIVQCVTPSADYYEVYLAHSDTARTINGSAALTFFSACRVG
jgi:hypothetical protein